jgi:Flp pilus assembly protein protease CpaA
MQCSSRITRGHQSIIYLFIYLKLFIAILIVKLKRSRRREATRLFIKEENKLLQMQYSNKRRRAQIVMKLAITLLLIFAQLCNSSMAKKIEHEKKKKDNKGNFREPKKTS